MKYFLLCIRQRGDNEKNTYMEDIAHCSNAGSLLLH